MGLISFFGRKGKKESNGMRTALLLDDAKVELRKQLKMDPNKSFDLEWVRTTNLERSLVDQYGFEGIKLIFEYRNSDNYYARGNFPTDCPWHSLNDLSLEECIENNFRPVAHKLPRLIKALKTRCEFIYAERLDQHWYLHYFLQMRCYDGRAYYRVYTGGAPKDEVKPNANLQSFNWEIPRDLKEFYTVHDGFGEIYDANFILSANDIRVMGEMMNPIANEQGASPEGYSFDDLLEFFPDGSGNAQCFRRIKENNNTTVDWDHEVWEISEQIGFYEFVDERMCEIDEE